MAHRFHPELAGQKLCGFATKGRLVVERLPAYAPELNPVEYMWGHLKNHEIANLIVTKAWELQF